MGRYARRVRSALILLVLTCATLWVVVWWLQPRMAFFPWPGVQRTPSDAGIPFDNLEITTSDGIRLHGWWMAHPSPRAAVIYWHGNGGNLSLWLDVLADIHRRGFSVLAVDYRGYGASAGSPTEQGIYLDARAVTAHYRQHLRRPDVPTLYWGRSLGCSVASHAVREHPPDALILESPFPDVRSLFAGNLVMTGLGLFASYRFPTSEHLGGYAGPLLVLHGDADSIIPFRAGRQVYDSASTTRKTLVVLDGADHNDVHAGHPAYWPAVDHFLENSLQPR
jgi:alpha-beta hydrolase superfamily lysophospholipase